MLIHVVTHWRKILGKGGWGVEQELPFSPGVTLTSGQDVGLGLEC